MFLKGQVCFAVLLLANVALLTEGLELKIYINPESQKRATRTARHAVSSKACRDRQAIARNTIDFPGNLSMLNQRVRFYRSVHVTDEINKLLNKKVAGLTLNVSEVLEQLSESGCSFFPHGGAIRDLFLEAGNISDIDFKVDDCDISLVRNLCSDRKWGSERDCSSTYVHIGFPKKKALDFGDSSGEFYGHIRNLEYTVNSLVYWTNRSIIMDIGGTGVEDVCCKTIRIPSDNDTRSSWEEWNDIRNNSEKLYRFWKLRVKDFTPFNDDTKNFIVEQTQIAIKRNASSFKDFYCKNAYNGAEFTEINNSCQVDNSTTCDKQSSLADQYVTALRSDLTSGFIQLPACSTAMVAAAMPKMISCLLLLEIIYLVF